VFSWSGAMTCTFGRLRTERQLTSSSRPSTTSRWRASLTVSSTLRAALVDGVSPSTRALTTCSWPARARSESAPRSAAAFIFFGVRWS
jgi:hypothetical protein